MTEQKCSSAFRWQIAAVSVIFAAGLILLVPRLYECCKAHCCRKSDTKQLPVNIPKASYLVTAGYVLTTSGALFWGTSAFLHKDCLSYLKSLK